MGCWVGSGWGRREGFCKGKQYAAHMARGVHARGAAGQNNACLSRQKRQENGTYNEKATAVANYYGFGGP